MKINLDVRPKGEMQLVEQDDGLYTITSVTMRTDPNNQPVPVEAVFATDATEEEALGFLAIEREAVKGKVPA